METPYRSLRVSSAMMTSSSAAFSCTLAQPVDAALDLPRALGYGGEAVADRLPKVVVTVNA